MFIDTHCHFNIKNAKKYVKNAKEANVKILINASEDLKSSIENVYLCDMFSNVFACIGVHPLNVNNFDENTFSEFEKLINNNKVKAIGEIGLDFHYSKDNRDLQIHVFRKFLSLAQEYNLPVVIHSRDATLDTIKILKEYKVKGIIHCFSGSVETAREYIKLGFLIGIGGVLTFKNSKLNEVIEEIDLSYIVLETDAPYLTPEPYRKFENESKYIPIIGECVAKYKGVLVDEVMSTTTENAIKIFDL